MLLIFFILLYFGVSIDQWTRKPQVVMRHSKRVFATLACHAVRIFVLGLKASLPAVFLVVVVHVVVVGNLRRRFRHF